MTPAQGRELHAVVGGVRFAAEQFFFVAAIAHQHAPAAFAGVAFACAVGVERYGFVLGHKFFSFAKLLCF